MKREPNALGVLYTKYIENAGHVHWCQMVCSAPIDVTYTTFNCAFGAHKLLQSSIMEIDLSQRALVNWLTPNEAIRAVHSIHFLSRFHSVWLLHFPFATMTYFSYCPCKQYAPFHQSSQWPIPDIVQLTPYLLQQFQLQFFLPSTYSSSLAFHPHLSFPHLKPQSICNISFSLIYNP